MITVLLLGLVLLLIFGLHVSVTWSGVVLFFLGYFWCLSAFGSQIAKLRENEKPKPEAKSDEDIVYGLPDA